MIYPEPFLESDVEAHIVYVTGQSTEKIEISTLWESEQEYWSKTTRLRSGADNIQLLFNAAVQGLRAIVSSDGRFDSGVWQYGMEWARDASRVAEALIYSGQFELSKKVLTNILTRLTNSDGMAA